MVVRQNRHGGTFTLAGLPDGRGGGVLVIIDFTVDGDGLLHVSAKVEPGDTLVVDDFVLHVHSIVDVPAEGDFDATLVCTPEREQPPPDG